jgi:putative ABC transport system permease protein
MIGNYLKIALRLLGRQKLFSAINIAGLSLGLAACMLIMLYAKDELSFDRFQEKAPTLYRLVRDEYGPDKNLVSRDGNTGMVHGPSFAREIPEIMQCVRFQGERLSVKVGNQVFEQEGHYADSNFFSVFSFPMLTGDPLKALENPYSVVLSAETAKKLFGTVDAYGKTMELPLGTDRAFIPFKVTGVVPESPLNSSIRISMLLPMSLNTRNGGGDDQWINFYLSSFFLLHPDADTAKVQQKLTAIYAKLAARQIQEAKEKYNFNNTMVYRLQPFLDMHLSTVYTATNGLNGASSPVYSRILSGIALFILLIACINFINLSVARSLKRSREIGIRKVTGGTRQQLILQFLGESLLLTMLAFMLALLLVQAILPFFNTVANKQLALGYLLDWKLGSGYILLMLFTAFMAGFYPALVLSGFDPATTLYNRTKLTSRNYLSKGLIVLQFALSTFLIVATITIHSQFNYLTQRPLGYNDKNLLTFRTGELQSDRLNSFRTELLKLPQVEKVTARQGGFWFTVARVDGKEMDFGLEVVDDNYLQTLEIPLVKGRGFSPDFPGDSATSIMVNESFVKKAGWSDPIGKEVDFFYFERKYRVIGVVKDYHYESLLGEIKPQLMIKDPKYRYGLVGVRIREGKAKEALPAIEGLFKQLFPLVPWQYEFKEEQNRRQYESEQRWRQIIAFGAALTILISCIGLFGLATLTAEKRKKEIGIRKVLGASVSSVANRLSVDFLKLVFISALIALPASWWASNKWLENYPFRIEVSAWIMLGALLAVVLVALCTVSYQAIRAAMANPVASLRSE